MTRPVEIHHRAAEREKNTDFLIGYSHSHKGQQTKLRFRRIGSNNIIIFLHTRKQRIKIDLRCT